MASTDTDQGEPILVEIVYDIWDEEENRTQNVRYPLELTRAGVIALIAAADEVALDYTFE